MRSAEPQDGGATAQTPAQVALDATLLDVVRRSIDHGLAHGAALPVEPRDFPPPLREPAASFVTLRRGGALRGCTGSLTPSHALVADVAANAFSAAFRDPRFEPLAPEERADLEIHVSILGPLEPLPVASEAELLRALRPGIDGLVIAEGTRRATFLPAVWETLRDPAQFVAELKRKAGLPADHWSPQMRCWRYCVREIG